MNVRVLLRKFFFFGYLMLFVPYILKLSISSVGLVTMILGIVFAIVAHQSKYTALALVFLIIHMTLELPHILEYVHHGDLGISLGHGVHIVFDLVLLYTLNSSSKSFFFSLVMILLIAPSIGYLDVSIVQDTKPFVIGGIIGCIGTHLFLRDVQKKPTV